ncbi:hypothetical protein CA13_58200 [Planctomycetes bacterium CA13]|uniref:Uncharacterized protein n=2 Tax=Novipirellula herctigrandis TaxID=2527986 RepID=A0A5C5ZCN7_9BACT|nr:hypothetical protein CA13_58200 [Planctomycetes bacterium CA13]
MSGLRPSTSGCYSNQADVEWKEYIPEGMSVNAVFKDAGYQVMGIGKIFHVPGPDIAYASEWDDYPKNTKRYGGGAARMEGFLEPMTLDLKDEDLNDWHYADYCIEQLNNKCRRSARRRACHRV